MALSYSKIRQAVIEKRTFSWEYSDDKGYVLYGQLPRTTAKKVIGHTHDCQKARCAGRKWLCEQYGCCEQWQQLATLINQHETATPVHYKPKEKTDTETLDIFTTVKGGK